MPIAETARIAVQLDLEGNFRQGIKGVKRDLRQFGKDVRTSATKDVDGLRSTLTKTKASLKSFGPQMRGSILQGVGLSGGLIGFELLGRAIGESVNYMSDGITMASDLREAINKVDQVFEGSAPSVRRWASELDAAYGISERDALKASSSLGGYLITLGQTEEEASDLSTRLVELAGDLSSFNNVAREDVLGAIRAGLAGSSEPLRRLGVDISAVAVNAELAALGLEKVNGKYSESQKLLGRTSLLFKQTTKAQGDALRTQDELAGRQRQLDARLENLQTRLGGIAVPVVEEAAGAALFLLDLLDDASDGVTQLSDAVRVDLAGEFVKLFRYGPVAGSANVLANDVLPAVQGNLQDIGGEIDKIIDTGQSLPGIFGDWQREAQRALGHLTGEIEDSAFVISGAWVGAIGDAREETEGLEQAQTSATTSVFRFSDAVMTQTARLSDNADAFSEVNSLLATFRDNASEIAGARSISKINAELEQQRRKQREAAEAGKVREFARREAIIQELKEERKLRRQGERGLKEYLSRTKKQTAAQRLVTAGIVDTKEEAKKLLRQTRKEYKLSVKVDRSQIADGIIKLRTLGELAGSAAQGRGVTLSTGFYAGARKDGATGAVYRPGDYGYVGERGPERIRNVGGVTTITPIGASRPMSVSLALRPEIAISASTIVASANRVTYSARIRPD